MPSSAWQKETVDTHNRLRALHGSPGLSWSDECYQSAKKAANACQARGGMFHNTTHGPSGRHGQNIYHYMGPGRASAAKAMKLWYDEVKDYNWRRPGFTGGTGHFTQVVWAATRRVGMAASADGKFIVANYYPGGNVTNAGQFERNVPPPVRPGEAQVPGRQRHERRPAREGRRHRERRGPQPARPAGAPEDARVRPPRRQASAGGSGAELPPGKRARHSAIRKEVVATSMTPELRECLKGFVPDRFKREISEALKGPGTVTGTVTVTCVRR